MFSFCLHVRRYDISVVALKIHSAGYLVKWCEKSFKNDLEEGRCNGIRGPDGSIMRSIHYVVGVLRVLSSWLTKVIW